MNQVKCECGHINPIGTILCEACGRALTDQAKKEKLHDMRYEGSARRSQTYNRTIIDKVWNFFSSVKVGVWLIVITLIASGLGTLLPQIMYIPPDAMQDPSTYYAENYGFFGSLYSALGLHDMYSSWWYLLLVASIGVSLVICSLDRFIPLHRALKNQKVSRHIGFLKRQRLFIEKEVNESLDEDFETVKKNLKAKKYRLREENGHILAEKNRFSRWGPYVNHIGLILFLIGCMLRFIPGMYLDERLWIREGETKVIPGTNEELYLENKQFTMEVYDPEKDREVYNATLEKTGTVVKNFQTDYVLYERDQTKTVGEEDSLHEVQEGQIRVNKPLKYKSFALYQFEYRLNELKSMTFDLVQKDSGESKGQLTIDLFDPKEEYDLGNGYKVVLDFYYPDFSGFGENGEPQSETSVPNNPAFLFNMISPEHPDGEVSFTAIQQTMEPLGATDYKMTFKDVETRHASILIVKKDLTLWVLIVGGAIFMFGVIQGSYWNHRRVWLQKDGNKVVLAAHSNKNWYSLKKEISSIVENTNIPEPVDQQETNKSE